MNINLKQIRTFTALALSILMVISALADLKPATVAAFDNYAGHREVAVKAEVQDRSKFLWVDHLEQAQREKAYQDLRAGKVLIDQGKQVKAPDGLIHHWTGVIFIPGATLPQTLKFIQDYNHHASNYSPDVVASRLISQNGTTYRINQRYKKKKALTVVLDTDQDIWFLNIDAQRAASFGRTTRVSEVEDPGSPKEKLLPQGQGMGFLWKMNAYWRFLEQDNGTYVQCETISLTRDIPTGLQWAIKGFVNSVPRESLSFTLNQTRVKVAALK